MTHDARDLWAWLERRHSLRGPARHIEIWPDGALSISRGLADAPHRGFHAAIHIGLTGPFMVHHGASSVPERVPAVIIGSNVRHSTDTAGAVVASLSVDPESAEFARIRHWFDAQSPICVLPHSAARSLREQIVKRLTADDPFAVIWDAALLELRGSASKPACVDFRVRRTVAFLKANYVDPPSMSELAKRVNLSVSRLVHLFKASMGVSIRTYVHWLRMRDVLYAIASGESLTLAAHRAGFADLPHLTRKFRDMFGEPPSRLGQGGTAGTLAFVNRLHDDSPHSATDVDRIEQLLRGRRARSLYTATQLD
jgi:AraC-like DNA-binding protein